MSRSTICIVACLLFGGCGTQSIPQQEGTLSVRIIEKSENDGVVGATCPSGTRIVGGGCDCTLPSRVFGASPAGNGYVCGCCCQSSSTTPDPVTAFATCLASTKSGQISQALDSEPVSDPDTEWAIERLRRSRAQQLAGSP